MQRDNFAVEKVVLAQQQEVPADAAVLVIAGPKNDFLQPELDMVQRYLDKGGKLLLLIDPPDGPNAAPLTGLITLARNWGIDVGANVVVDVSSVGQLLGAGPSVPVVATYPDHPITENFGLITAFPLARSVTPVEGGTNGRTAQAIATTSAQSWAETDLAAVFDGANLRLLIATASIVAFLLVITYRSPVLWLIPLTVIGVADRVATVTATHTLDYFDIPWDESTVGILSVLVFGAGTDYALLLISRYRDELRRHADRRPAMAAAMSRTAEAVVSSGHVRA